MTLTAEGVFALGDGRSGADFGRAVHELLAEVEWCPADVGERLASEWGRRGAEPAAVAAALACLRAPALVDVFARKPGGEVWRERAFEMLLDGAWVTGILDRVVVERSAAGRAVQATVFDFKTDTLAGEADLASVAGRHAGQLRVYRRAVAQLTKLDVGAVRAELVLTRPLVRVAVPD